MNPIFPSKFEKQGSGMISLNFDATPQNKAYEFPVKDSMDQFSFTLKSKDDCFGNQAFGDYEFGNLSVMSKAARQKKESPSPYTRRQKAIDAQKLKETIKNSSPERFSIDWEKMTHCPCCSQTLPKDRSKINKEIVNINLANVKGKTDESTNKGHKRSRLSRSPAREPDAFRDTTPRMRLQSEASNPEPKKKNKEEDPNQNKRRKTKAQVKMLEAELEKNPHWTNENMIEIAKKTGLSKSQVYKWNWDQKKKLNILPSKVYVVQLPGDLVDNKTGQIVLKSPEELKKLQAMNLDSIIQNTKVVKTGKKN